MTDTKTAKHADARPEPVLDLSIVIPAYDEAEAIGVTLRTIADHFADRGRRVELIVVDDGSSDGTADAVRAACGAAAGGGRFAVSDSVSLRVLRSPHLGKGGAVRLGGLAAGGECVLICDADLSTPIDELGKLERWLATGFDVVIGSRDMPDSQLSPPQPLRRRLLAWAFRALRRRIALPEIHDTQCGFKLLTRRAAQAVFAAQKLDGWLFDCEILMLAQQSGMRIKEVGVRWHDRADSRVRPLRDAWPVLRDLLKLRRLARRRRQA
ncbi:MAG: glycosyltransferase family 2 protein [Planctomycetes bacterium]|nr:glycosyltransferase family 2 protein [Planctomycetota bacterium]